MSESNSEAGDDPLDESNLTLAFISELFSRSSNRRCSTPQQREQLRESRNDHQVGEAGVEQAANVEEAAEDAIVEPAVEEEQSRAELAEEAANEVPAASDAGAASPPSTPTPPSRPPARRRPRRKQPNPLNRYAMFRREVRRLQQSPNYMIPRLSFGRVVRWTLMQQTVEPYRITVGALEALQTSTEMFLTQRFQDSYLMTMHRSRVTLEVRDMALMAFVCKLHGQP